MEGWRIEWTTHVLSGAAVGYWLTSDWKGAAMGGAAALLPDIDDPRSHIGRPFFFLAIPIHTLFGHRTLTHSLGFVMAVMVALLPFWPGDIPIIAGLLAHIGGDVMTGKVNLFYPFPVSVGLPVSRMGYLLIDRVTRVGMGLMLLITIAQPLLKSI